MKKQKPLNRKHWKDEFSKWYKKYFRKEERRLNKIKLKEENKQ